MTPILKVSGDLHERAEHQPRHCLPRQTGSRQLVQGCPSHYQSKARSGGSNPRLVVYKPSARVFVPKGLFASWACLFVFSSEPHRRLEYFANRQAGPKTCCSVHVQIIIVLSGPRSEACPFSFRAFPYANSFVVCTMQVFSQFAFLDLSKKNHLTTSGVGNNWRAGRLQV